MGDSHPSSLKLWAPWRLEGEALRAGKQDATLIWLKEQEDAGIDIVTDGEQSRIHFVHGFLENILTKDLKIISLTYWIS